MYGKLPRNRREEPWRFVSNPINYQVAGGIRSALVTFPPIEQRTRNAIVGGQITGTVNGDSWRNRITQFRVESNNYLIGPGCVTALMFAERRLTGNPSGNGDVPSIPTVPGVGYWPGETFDLYTCPFMVAGVPMRAPDRIDMRIVNINGDAANDIQQIVLLMLEIPFDAGAPNKDEMERQWQRFKNGIGAITFGTHQIGVPAAGLVNFQDPLVLTTWNNLQLRRTDLRGGLLFRAPAGPLLVNEDLYFGVDMNTRSDRTRDQNTALVSAKLQTGIAGQPDPGMAPLDYKSDGSDRDIITVNVPAHIGDEEVVEFLTILAGIEERQYYGRIGGQAY